MAYLVIAAIAVVGWLIGVRFNNYVPYFVHYVLIFLTTLFIAVLFTGFLRFGKPDSTHGDLGHWLVIGAFIAVPLAIGLTITRYKHLGFIRLSISTAVLIALLMIIGTEMMVGYLGPSHRTPAAEEVVNIESANRFMVLHLYFLPTLITVLLGASLWLTRQSVRTEIMTANDAN
jgi:uncharacterized membrane protein AbrB (regulator of aidB expression)